MATTRATQGASGLALLLATAPAWAAVSSGASFTALTLTVTDLDPLDGIEASVRFLGGSFASSWLIQQDMVLGTPSVMLSDVAFGAGQIMLSLPSATAQVQAQPATSAVRFGAGVGQPLGELHTAGSAAPDFGYAAAAGWNGPTAQVPGPSFLVSAGTGVTISGLAQVTAQSDSPWTWASAQVLMLLEASPAAGPYHQDLAVLSRDTRTTGSGAADAPLSVSWLNTGDAGVQARFYAEAAVNGAAFTSVVPEPATAWLWAAGLAAVWRPWQRRRAASHPQPHGA